jgi:hypothetical protein
MIVWLQLLESYNTFKINFLGKRGPSVYQFRWHRRTADDADLTDFTDLSVENRILSTSKTVKISQINVICGSSILYVDCCSL